MSDAAARGEALRRVVAWACDLPSAVVGAVAGRLEAAAGTEAEQCVRALDAVTQEGARASLEQLLDQCVSAGASCREIAWALRAADATDDWHRRRQQLELVWTGPTPMGTSLRRTDQALLELVRGATRRILLVTFAAYRVPTVHDALVLAAGRGVRIDFVFESPEESQGRVSVDPRLALGADLARVSTVWTWPLDQRERDERQRHGTLHAKCALADDHRLLVSSANFTSDALLLNMELGVLIEGGDLPRDVGEHFAALRRDGVLRRG